MLQGNLDDLVTSKIRANRRVLATLANDIGFVGLYWTGQRLGNFQLWISLVYREWETNSACAY